MTADRTIQESIRISTGQRRITAAFFTPGDLREWWGTGVVVAEPRPGGLLLLTWPADRTGRVEPWAGTLAGVVRGFHPTDGFTVGPTHWIPPDGPPLGPTELTVRIDGKINQSVLTVRQAGFGNGPQWGRFEEMAAGGWKSCLASLKNYLES